LGEGEEDDGFLSRFGHKLFMIEARAKIAKHRLAYFNITVDFML
jgi:hypothetical protein